MFTETSWHVRMTPHVREPVYASYVSELTWLESGVATKI